MISGFKSLTVGWTASLVLYFHGQVVSTPEPMHLTATVELSVVVTADKLRHFLGTAGWTFTRGVVIATFVRVRNTHAASRTYKPLAHVILAVDHLDRKKLTHVWFYQQQQKKMVHNMYGRV